MTAMNGSILVINAGSSSLKFSIHTGCGRGDIRMICKGQIEGLETTPHFVAKAADGAKIAEHRWPKETRDARDQSLGFLLDWIERHPEARGLAAVGHRVVHGGATFIRPIVVDGFVMAELAALIALAPLHQPHNLAPIQAISKSHPALAQVACFDTAFHQGHAAVVDRFALPEELHDIGIRRYGFHGLSYEYIARTLPEVAPAIAGKRVVVAHLGNGASLCAMHNGRSVDSTMGFTALDGLPMGTRCGSLDPGVILFLMQQHGRTAAEIEDLLYHRSGLLGVSGVSSDMRDLLSSKDPRARLAVDLFVHRVSRELGSLAAVLGGVDGLVFTAGIGENSPQVRARVCDAARWLGIELNPSANERNDACITTERSRMSVWVIPTDEERMIAQHAIDCLKGQRAGPAP